MKLEKLEHEEYERLKKENERLKKENEELRKCVEILNGHFKWTRIDLNDPKTFPQGDEEEVLLYVTCHNRENIEKFIMQATVNWISRNECYFSDFNGDEVHDNVDDITHWSPLPKPPIEEKA